MNIKKKNKKIVSDNIWELIINIKGEQADNIPESKKRDFFISFAVKEIKTQFIESTTIWKESMPNKLFPSKSIINWKNKKDPGILSSKSVASISLCTVKALAIDQFQ